MDWITVGGSDVGEAIQRAVRELGVDRSLIEIVYLYQGKIPAWESEAQVRARIVDQASGGVEYFALSNDQGMSLIQHRLCPVGSYLKFGKPLIFDWLMPWGSYARYFRVFSAAPRYRDAVVEAVEEHFNSGAAGLAPVRESLRQLVRLFEPGDYSIRYKPARTEPHPGGFRVSIAAEPQPGADGTAGFLEDADSSTCLATASFCEGQCVPTQPASQIDQDRVRYYEDLISKGHRPTAVFFRGLFEILHQSPGERYMTADETGGEPYIIDGHHKLLAYRNLDVLPATIEITRHYRTREEVRFTSEDFDRDLRPRLRPAETRHFLGLHNWERPWDYL